MTSKKTTKIIGTRMRKRFEGAAKVGPWVVHVSAHWRDTDPDGIGLLLQFSPPNGKAFVKVLDETVLDMDMRGVLPQAANEFLKTFVSRGKPEEDRQLAVATIHWLETRGHLPSDEYNGITWGVIDGRVYKVLRRDEPTPVAWAKIARNGTEQEIVRIDPDRYETLVNDLLGRLVQ